MKGKRIVDEKIEQARLLRQKGFSVREIARRLRISKSSADRFSQGIPVQSDEPQTPEELDMSQNITEPEESVDPEFRSYLETLVHIRRFIALAEEMNDDAGVDMGMRGLYQLHLMVIDYFQRRFPELAPPRMPYVLREYISKQISTREVDSGSTFPTPMSPQLERAIAEHLRLTRKENDALIQEWKSDNERRMLRLIQGFEEDASRIRDLERKRS